MTATLRGAWALPEAADEFPHVPTGASDDLPWKDTYWFGFRDEAADITGAVHLTLSANRAPGLRATVGLRRGSRQIQRTAYDVPTRTDDTFGCPMVGLQILDGSWDERKHLRLSLDVDDVRGTIEIRGRHLGPDLARLCPGLLPTASAVQLSGHAEQGITIEGALDFAGDRVALSGYGHRDRSWGYRKSDGMTRMGTIFAGARLPEATLGFLGWQNPDATSAESMPVGAWLADATGVRAAVDGWYRRGADGRPMGCGFRFADGETVDLEAIEPTAELFYSFHEPEYDGSAIGTLCWDQHMLMRSPAGLVSAVFNHGVPFGADAFRNARFCAAQDERLPSR